MVKLRCIRCVGHARCKGIKNFNVEESEGRCQHKLNKGMNIDFKEVGCEDTGSIHLAHDRL